MNKKTTEKIQISKTAASLYLKNSRFTMQALAEESGIEKEAIFDFFSNRRDVLNFFYEGVMLEYRSSVEAIDNYHSYTLSEKLSNLALTGIELMDPHKEFVRKTYTEYVQCTSRSKEFNTYFIEELESIYRIDSNQSRISQALNNKLLYKAGLTNFHLLIQFWLKDKSAGNQKTMELVDKWTSFVQELHYSSILDRGFDVAKFLYYNSPFRPSKN